MVVEVSINSPGIIKGGLPFLGLGDFVGVVYEEAMDDIHKVRMH